MIMSELASNVVCIFCDRPWGEVNKSTEHVFGHLRRRRGNLPNERVSHTTGLTFDVASQQFIHEPIVTKTSSSSLLNLRTRRVCESCNTGWMSKLEQQAKPHLIALDHAAKEGEQLNLSPSDALTVARWALKTAITNELTIKGRPKVADSSMGSRLREGKAIRGSVVWVASNKEDLDLQLRHVYIEISDTPIVRSGDPYRLVFMCAITWHYLTLLVYVGTPGRLGPSLPFDQWTPISPCSSSGIEYPPMRAVSAAELNSRLTDQRDWLPVVRNFGLHWAAS
jgi:hypothetical protein